MIVDKSALVFAKPHLDLTNELIRRYNTGKAGGGRGPRQGARQTEEVDDACST